MTTHIVAMGGGGFSMSSNGAVTNLDRYLLNLVDTSNPTVCFAPTASADSPEYVRRFLDAFRPTGVRTSVLTLWENAAESLKRAEEADILYVGGGSTVNLMALWHAHGVTDMIRRRMRDRDLVLAGLSAGASVWFEGCTTDSFDPKALRAWRGGMGLIPGSFCPHYDGEAERAPFYANAIAIGALPDGYGAEDGAAVHAIDGELHRFIAERPGPKVHKVYGSFTPTTSGVVTEEQRTRLIRF